MRVFTFCSLVISVVCLTLCGRVAAGHPILADVPENQSWHAPATSTEAVYVGNDKTPTMVIKKSVVQGTGCTITIQADGKWCILRCGSVQLPLELYKERPGADAPKDKTTVLKLDGASEQPNVSIDGKDVMAAKGKWIQICSADSPVISIELSGSSFANVKFGAGGSDAGAIGKDTPAGVGGVGGGQNSTVALARAKHGVFHLFIHGDFGGKPLRAGTAFLIDASGKAVTNYHIIQGGISAEASAAGHEDQKLRADLLAVLPDFDLALLQVHVEDSVNADVFPLDLAANAPKEGQKIFGLGFPESGYTINRGVIKGVHKFKEMPEDMQRALQSMAADSTWVQTDCTVDAGSSGGPLVDEGGHVIGVSTWHWMETQNNYFAISGAHINALLERAATSPTSFNGDKRKFAVGGSGLASPHGIPTDLPQLLIDANVKPQQMVQAAIAFRSNGLKVCPVCGGKGEVSSRVKTGEQRGGMYVQSTYRDSTSTCPTCHGTGRVQASPEALDRLMDKLLSSIAGVNSNEKDYADRLQAVGTILAETVAVDRDAQLLLTKEAVTAFPLSSTKSGRAFIVRGRVEFTEPFEKTHGQLYAVQTNEGLKTVLLTDPRIADVAEGDEVVAGGLLAGRAGSDTHQMPVLQQGFILRVASHR